MKTLIAGELVAAGLMAQSQSGPPTYDYNPDVQGTQGPTSPLVDGYTYRSVRQYQIAVPVLVPVDALTAALPPGFVPIPTAPGTATATVTLNFFLDQRFQPTVGGPTYGPVTALLATTTATNTTVVPSRNEIVFPLFEVSGGVAELNAVFGAGAARLAKVEAEVSQDAGVMKFQFKVEDKGTGLKMDVSLEGSMDINARAKSDPVGLPFRAFTGFVPNRAFRAASQSDTLTIAAATAKTKLLSTGNRLVFPSGSMPILGLGANVTLSRGVEFFLKFE